MRTNALPTIVLDTPHFRRAASVLVAKLSMIHSRFSARCSAGPGLEAGFSRHSSVVPVAHALKISVADRICATTWKSNWKRRLLARPNRSRSQNWIPAISAAAAALKQARTGSAAPLAVGAVRSSVHADFFTFRRHVLAVAAPVTSSKSHARNAAARGAWKIEPR